MRSHPLVFVAALGTAVSLVLLGVPGLAQVPPGPPLPPTPVEDQVRFEPSDAMLRQLADNPPTVGVEYSFDLCGRGVSGTPGGLKPTSSPCGDPLNPSSSVSGGNPPYHFQLETMGGFPPMGMFIDLNGVLRGRPRSTQGATFSVCAVDMSGNSSCRPITINGIQGPVPQPPQPQPAASPAGKPGGNGGKLVMGTILAGGALAAGIYAARVAGNLATTSTSAECYSSRNCIVNVMSSGCSCGGSLNAGCDWTQGVGGTGDACGGGMPCRAGLSCNNGRCEGSGGRCPF